MTRMLKTVASCSLIAVAMAGASPAYAVGTTAGGDIVNTATVNFSVGGVAQAEQTASNTFKVDRKINLLVEEVGNATTSVAPGSTNQVTAFKLTNLTNDVMDFSLATVQQAGGTASHNGTDSFNVTNVRIYADTNANGILDAAELSAGAITFVDNLAADGVVNLLVVGDVPAGLTTGAVADVGLVATAHAGGTAGLGTLSAATTGANTTGVDNVFADAAGTEDAANDGKHSDNDDYTVAAAALTVLKTSRVISDPVNGTTNPKLIPGAVVEYCISVANAAGGAAADNVAISDTVPATLAPLTTAGTFKLNGTVVSGVCQSDGALTPTIAGQTVSGTIPSIAAGDTRTLLFRATIQ